VIAASWRLLGPPLRPVDEDLHFVREAALRWEARAARAPNVVILGVTPELWKLPWPDGAKVRAVDRAVEMIEHVWPGPAGDAEQGDWLDLPFADESVDIVVCDGGWHLLDGSGQVRLATELARVVAPHGCFVARLFTPPDVPETPAEVVADLWDGAIPSLNHLKLRLGMALADENRRTYLPDVWRFVNDLDPDWSSLAGKLGWDVEHLAAIDAYRNADASYVWATTNEVVGQLCNGEARFVPDSVASPTYLLGERCPTIVVRKDGP
jgi:SAM-dependent methyltransferase